VLAAWPLEIVMSGVSSGAGLFDWGVSPLLCGAPGKIRTSDLLVRSPRAYWESITYDCTGPATVDTVDTPNGVLSGVLSGSTMKGKMTMKFKLAMDWERHFLEEVALKAMDDMVRFKVAHNLDAYAEAARDLDATTRLIRKLAENETGVPQR
jgi:hypothetical protein